jgi:hypothetical protein
MNTIILNQKDINKMGIFVVSIGLLFMGSIGFLKFLDDMFIHAFYDKITLINNAGLILMGLFALILSMMFFIIFEVEEDTKLFDITTNFVASLLGIIVVCCVIGNIYLFF